MSNGLPTAGCIGISLNDMDMDGNIDAVIWNAGFIAIYKGDGFGNWTQAGSFTIPETQMASFRTGDFDHDGYGDIAYIAKTSASNSKNMLRVYLHTANNPALNILPMNPKGYECFAPSSVQFLNWISSVPVSSTAAVKIEFSSAGNSGPWSTVVASAPNSGTYQWAVPNVSSPNCFLKFTITSGSNSQTITTANAFGIGTCTNPPPTSVNEEGENVFGFEVYPNPISTQGYAHFHLDKSADVKIQITDMLGKEVYVLMNENLSVGFYNPRIPVEVLESGVYFCNMIADGKTEVKKMVVTK